MKALGRGHVSRQGEALPFCRLLETKRFLRAQKKPGGDPFGSRAEALRLEAAEGERFVLEHGRSRTKRFVRLANKEAIPLGVAIPNAPGPALLFLPNEALPPFQFSQSEALLPL